MFNRAQVVRTNRTLPAVDGTEVPAGTRLVVTIYKADTEVTLKVADPKHPTMKGLRVKTGSSRLTATHRGRPMGSTKVKSA